VTPPGRGAIAMCGSAAWARRAALRPHPGNYRMGIPESVRAMTSRWISLVPSKIV
jgi:hypothetical protein